MFRIPHSAVRKSTAAMRRHAGANPGSKAQDSSFRIRHRRRDAPPPAAARAETVSVCGRQLAKRGIGQRRTCGPEAHGGCGRMQNTRFREMGDGGRRRPTRRTATRPQARASSPAANAETSSGCCIQKPAGIPETAPNGAPATPYFGPGRSIRSLRPGRTQKLRFPERETAVVCSRASVSGVKTCSPDRRYFPAAFFLS